MSRKLMSKKRTLKMHVDNLSPSHETETTARHLKALDASVKVRRDIQ